MPPISSRRPTAIASALAVGAAAILGGPTAASASHSGSAGSQLSASNQTSTIRFSSGSTLNLASGEKAYEASWSPDGSRAVFATGDGRIATVRYNDGSNIWDITPADPDTERRSPSWRGTGSGLVWAAKPVGQTWRLELSPSISGYTPGQLTDPDGGHLLNPDGSDDDRFVFERRPDSGGTPGTSTEIKLYDPALPGFTRSITTDASNPSISPGAGNKVAFVRSGQIWVSDLEGGNLVQITSNAATHDDPTWSPDGTTIAFKQGSGVATAPANGSGAANPTVVTGLTGVPAYQSRRIDKVMRLSGQGRYATAAQVSKAHWADAGVTEARKDAQSVVLSRSDAFADALGGSALAAAKQGPLLMTAPTTLDAATKAEIVRVLSPGEKVYLLGGPGAISQAVQNEINALGFTTVRLAGGDRFATSVAIANAINPDPDLVLVATGMDFPDALAAGAAAGSYNQPTSGYSAVVVLTNNATLPAATQTYLDGLPAESEIFGVGGMAYSAVQSYGAVDIVGPSRYWTAVLTAWTFFGGNAQVGLATGTDWPDALAGGALMADINGPLLLTPGASADLGYEPSVLLDEQSGSIHTAIVFGGPGVVQASQEGQIGSWISGPGSYAKSSNGTILGPQVVRTSTNSRGTAPAGEQTHRSPAEAAKAAAAAEAEMKRHIK